MVEGCNNEGMTEGCNNDGMTEKRLTPLLPPQVEVIPTGSLSLDHALGIGGLPRGRVVEVKADSE